MVPDIIKYPRTRHVRGSRFQHGDHDMEAVPWEELAGKHLVVEEKMDGANCGVSFTGLGTLMLQSRGHYLRGGPREKHFDLLKQWATSRRDDLWFLLGSRYVMYGEWMFAKHTMFYDALPHYFMEFDVLDRHTGTFLSTPARDLLLARAAGVEPADAAAHTDPSDLMEGLYVKWEEDGEVKGRYKFVRDSFTSSIMDQEQHWHDRPIIQNRLVPGALERMFS